MKEGMDCWKINTNLFVTFVLFVVKTDAPAILRDSAVAPPATLIPLALQGGDDWNPLFCAGLRMGGGVAT